MKTFKYFSYILLLCMSQSIFCALAYTHSSVWMAAVGVTTVLSYYIGQRSVEK